MDEEVYSEEFHLTKEEFKTMTADDILARWPEETKKAVEGISKDLNYNIELTVKRDEDTGEVCMSCKTRKRYITAGFLISLGLWGLVCTGLLFIAKWIGG